MGCARAHVHRHTILHREQSAAAERSCGLTLGVGVPMLGHTIVITSCKLLVQERRAHLRTIFYISKTGGPILLKYGVRLGPHWCNFLASQGWRHCTYARMHRFGRQLIRLCCCDKRIISCYIYTSRRYWGYFTLVCVHGNSGTFYTMNDSAQLPAVAKRHFASR